jgi:hypothetical protein
MPAFSDALPICYAGVHISPILGATGVFGRSRGTNVDESAGFPSIVLA